MLSFKLFCVVVLLKLAAARYAFIPKFVPDESRVNSNSDKSLPVVPLEPYNPLAYYRLVHQYPAYHIIPPMQKTKLTKPAGSSSTTTTTPSTTTTTVAPDTQDEFPSDLLEIAQRKLGIKRLEEIPTITELGQLLGTSGAEETLKYIRQLTSTDQGIALMKAYIESADYTDSMGSNSNNADDNGSEADDDEEDNDDEDDDDEPTMEEKNDLVVVDSDSKPLPVVPKPGFLERMSEYLSIYNLWPQQQKVIEATQKYQPKFVRKPQVAAPAPVAVSKVNTNVIHKPMLVRNPLPYHYPIPLRALPLPGQVRIQANSFAKTPLVHLNTPKAVYAPHIQQLAKMAKISPQHLDSFLQNKPKLAALAAKVSRLPVAHETASLIDAQLLAAVGRAVEEDEDLKKLLSSTDTLK